MWKWGLLVAMAALRSCASSSEIRMNADLHVARARARAANGDTYVAQEEMDKAFRQYHKAEVRAYQEQYWY